MVHACSPSYSGLLGAGEEVTGDVVGVGNSFVVGIRGENQDYIQVFDTTGQNIVDTRTIPEVSLSAHPIVDPYRHILLGTNAMVDITSDHAVPVAGAVDMVQDLPGFPALRTSGFPSLGKRFRGVSGKITVLQQSYRMQFWKTVVPLSYSVLKVLVNLHVSMFYERRKEVRTINLLKTKRTRTTVSNPYALPKKKEIIEQLEADAILGASTEFTADFRKPEATRIKLYPVAGGVGISTLVQVSGGKLAEPIQTYGIETAEAVFWSRDGRNTSYSC